MIEDTIPFVPEHLNRIPVVFRGMSTDELFAMIGVGAIVGVAVATPVVMVVGGAEWFVTAFFIALSATVFVGSGVLRRIKRGKPATWFPRRLNLGLQRIGFVAGERLILRSGVWSTRSEKRLFEASQSWSNPKRRTLP